MPTPLSPHVIATIKATIPALQLHGAAITRRMYERMFETPAIRDLFNASHQRGDNAQAQAVAGAVLAYARNIDNLAVLGAAVERISQKHASLVIQPDHYPHVGRALLGAIQDVLGAAATPEILAAWGEAYGFLADILINRETAIYAEQAEARGGWNGWREFRVAETRAESQIITSFRLLPVDGKPVLRHRPGQYLCFNLALPGHGPARRNYSISSAPDGIGYRITVKREEGGLVSNWLHDHAGPGTILQAAAPAGDFFMPDLPMRPVVFLSGGVGLTPLVSMVETLVARPGNLPIHFVHGTAHGGVHAMGNHLRRLAAMRPGLSVSVFYATPRKTDIHGHDYDHPGCVCTSWLVANTPIGEADYYLCGPRGFLKRFVNDLAAAGVPDTRLHYEFFGPAEDLIAA